MKSVSVESIARKEFHSWLGQYVWYWKTETIGHWEVKKSAMFQREKGFTCNLQQQQKCLDDKDNLWRTMMTSDKRFHAENRKILLFLDNCPSHTRIDKQLKSIKVVFFPPNMTSKLQPMDHGILKNVKIHYRRRILRKTPVSLEDDDGPCPITLWNAISNISKA